MVIDRRMGVLQSALETENSSREECRYIKRDVRDLVFHQLFSQKEEVLKVYQALHPEDRDVTLDDIQITTLKNTSEKLAGNDLSFTVRGKTIFLLEAQTTENENAPLRILGYLLDLYQKMLNEKGERKALYRKKPVFLPVPEAYVIFSNTDEKRDIMSLARIHFEDEEVLEFKVKVITEDRASGIIWEYIRFCKVFKAMVSLYGSSRDAWDRVVYECMKQGILVDFLAKEGDKLMEGYHFLMTTDELWEEEIKSVRKECREKVVALEKEARTAEEKIRTAEEKIRTAEEKIRTAEEKTRIAEENAKAAKENARTAETRIRNVIPLLREKGMSDKEICELIQLSPEDLKKMC